MMEVNNLSKRKIIWFTGLSGSGKSTLAKSLKIKLEDKGFSTIILDGDELRKGLNSDLGFSIADRTENLRRAANVANIISATNEFVLCSFISPTEKNRVMIRNIIGKENMVLLHIDCSLEECQNRDPKGLYKKVMDGEIKNFTGIDSPYETPNNPDIYINTSKQDIENCTTKILAKIVE